MLSSLCRISPLLLLGTLSQVALGAVAQSDRQVVEQALWLKGKGQLEQASELLSRWRETHPESELLAVARAELYLAEDNPFWALKVLGEYQAAHPAACEARMLAARVHLEQANLEQAEALLKLEGCGAVEPIVVRRLLLEAELAELRGQGDAAKRLVGEADTHVERFEEDDDRLTRFVRAYDPERRPLWNFALDAGLGYASSGMGSVPSEVVTRRPAQGMAFTALGLLAQANWPNASPVRPVAEVELRAIEPFGDNPQDFGIERPRLSIGAETGRDALRLRLSYGYDFVSFDAGRGDGNGWFSSAHRGEYRLELGRGFSGTGQIGYRKFRDERLSRLESEQGLSSEFRLSESVGLGLTAMTRLHRAEHPAFEQVGVTGLATMTIELKRGFALVESLALSGDEFPRSEGFFAPNLEERRDRGIHAQGAILSPQWAGLRVALAYEYLERQSNAQAYEYSDHRALATLSYRTNHDEWRKKRIGPDGRVPMRHEKEAPRVEASEKPSAREVLRRDEELKRSSSCLK